MRIRNLFIVGVALCSLTAIAAKKKNPDDFTKRSRFPKILRQWGRAKPVA